MDTGVHLDLDHVHLTLLLKLESFHFHLNFFMMNFGTEKLRQDMIVEMIFSKNGSRFPFKILRWDYCNARCQLLQNTIKFHSIIRKVHKTSAFFFKVTFEYLSTLELSNKLAFRSSRWFMEIQLKKIYQKISDPSLIFDIAPKNVFFDKMQNWPRGIDIFSKPRSTTKEPRKIWKIGLKVRESR